MIASYCVYLVGWICRHPLPTAEILAGAALLAHWAAITAVRVAPVLRGLYTAARRRHHRSDLPHRIPAPIPHLAEPVDDADVMFEIPPTSGRRSPGARHTARDAVTARLCHLSARPSTRTATRRPR